MSESPLKVATDFHAEHPGLVDVLTKLLMHLVTGQKVSLVKCLIDFPEPELALLAEPDEELAERLPELVEIARRMLSYRRARATGVLTEDPK